MPCFSLLGEKSVSRVIVFLGDIVVNLGLLVKEKFPCLVQFGGTIVSANTWAHYATIPDAPDRDDKVFADKAQRVKAKLWVSLSRTILLNTSH